MLSVLKEGVSVNRFHPIEPILVCGFDEQLVRFSAENFSIPCSNWKMEKKISAVSIQKKFKQWNEMCILKYFTKFYSQSQLTILKFRILYFLGGRWLPSLIKVTSLRWIT
jgi:hypothetical protein